jgi:hypothetical protein
LKDLEDILEMEDIEIQRKELEDLFKKYQKTGQTVLDDKVTDINRK